MMDIGEFRGILTAILLALFVGLWVWSWSRRRDEEFGRAAQLPLEDGDFPPSDNSKKDGNS